MNSLQKASLRLSLIKMFVLFQIGYFAIIYILGSIIALDFDVSSWMLFTTWWGRIISIILEFWFLVVILLMSAGIVKGYKKEIEEKQNPNKGKEALQDYINSRTNKK